MFRITRCDETGDDADVRGTSARPWSLALGIETVRISAISPFEARVPADLDRADRHRIAVARSQPQSQRVHGASGGGAAANRERPPGDRDGVSRRAVRTVRVLDRHAEGGRQHAGGRVAAVGDRPEIDADRRAGRQSRSHRKAAGEPGEHRAEHQPGTRRGSRPRPVAAPLALHVHEERAARPDDRGPQKRECRDDRAGKRQQRPWAGCSLVRADPDQRQGGQTEPQRRPIRASPSRRPADQEQKHHAGRDEQLARPRGQRLPMLGHSEHEACNDQARHDPDDDSLATCRPRLGRRERRGGARGK